MWTSKLWPTYRYRAQQAATRSLTNQVRIYVYHLYVTNDKFRTLVTTKTNKDAITGRWMFDRCKAAEMIIAEARKNMDKDVGSAKEVNIYFCLKRILKAKSTRTKLEKLLTV